MDLEDCVRKYIKEGYTINDARSKVSQDVILIKIAKSNFKNHITIKGGVVMHNMSNSLRRATRDLDLDFIKYSLEDSSIRNFINKLNLVDDNIKIEIVDKITELHHQDYDGKRVYIKITDDNNYNITTKMDIGVHKLFDLKQEDYYFDFDIINNGVNLLINSCEQIFSEKLKSLLKLGFRSTRYKDLFDFYYLITNDKIDKRKLLETIKILIFDDDDMYENNLNDIYNRLNHTLNSKLYKDNLNNPKYNWLDISIDNAIKVVLDFILELEKIVVEV